ncbi:MAG: trehalose-phosphatase [Vitreimonas sp.]
MPPDQVHRPKLAAPPPLDVRRHALFLDLDGTLVEIAATPEDVVASAALRDTLGRLGHAMDGALALVTGRTIESADRILDGAVENIAGVHGFERRLAGAHHCAESDLAPLAAACAEARGLADAGLLRARIEDKAAAMALHYRHAPEAAWEVRRAADELADRHGLSVLEGKMVVELTLGVRTKGDAVAAFMHAPTFAGRTPMAVGDDVTDEDAFAAACALGGAGVLVGEPRPTSATYHLADSAQVAAWLTEALDR